LEKLPAETRRRLFAKIDSLRTNPRPRGSRKLEGGGGALRVRVGDHRILYEVHDERLRILVLVVGPRKDVYR